MPHLYLAKSASIHERRSSLRIAAALSRYGHATVNCPGSLIVHIDGTRAGCSLDDDADGCRGIEEHHEGDPIRCVDWFDGCNYCGVH
jgi:hypothetical protein